MEKALVWVAVFLTFFLSSQKVNDKRTKDGLNDVAKNENWQSGIIDRKWVK
ncbi:MAG: hypothetical protein QM737_15480 [Ferruginibacter sp.]